MLLQTLVSIFLVTLVTVRCVISEYRMRLEGEIKRLQQQEQEITGL
jgi:hypothetical protein